MSKRMLLEMVEKKFVSGWDDPRMPTIAGMRRRGYTPQAIRNFCSQIGVSKADSTVDMAFLEYFIREDLNKKTNRVMGVIKPLKVIIDNYPEGEQEELSAINNPEDIEAGTRKVPFSKVLYIEQDDFMEAPHPKFYRLSVGREVRLRYAYFIKCNSFVKDKDGKIVELHCSYDPLTRGGDAPDGRKVKATIHWVSAEHSVPAEVRLYGNLFNKENPSKTDEDGNFKDNLNLDSLQIVTGCRLEPSLSGANPGDSYQFERIGYFCVDPDSQNKEMLVFNRTVTLKDEWAKIKTAG
jgi:glutaminyl-tRNA synthetase